MPDPQVVASLHESTPTRRHLWWAAVKWPMYAVAVMPVLLAAGWRFGAGLPVSRVHLAGFLLAAVLLLAWENLANDVFDARTGVDGEAKPHSLVALTGAAASVALWSNACLLLGLALMLTLALTSSLQVFWLVLGCCGLGYLYQGPPFRLAYRGLGEPLCWLAFGPLATAAGLMVLDPQAHGTAIPWRPALELGSGPALATSLVLFCSHFHQVASDAAHGKRSPVVRLGTGRAAALVPWFIALTLALEWAPVLAGHWPLTALATVVALPAGSGLIRLLRLHHRQPERITDSKFLALRFQTLNGLALSLGLALAPWSPQLLRP
ncbi:2-carboxy-1,4-naphthoquinone phytyltransferase [Synechococcus sp. RSCCF101]|uniref:2-carboxy-1,4-naphthoquinone phytyltransferase n=1 Tax=Synechococcus sp. RSCCF101 TaxID=2511069 RepID=UPI00124493A4|nr:2-carboxy-1,4-naphthoquinone phytyltransferase [Synechococcus sp. RSCCF101]QEY32840.1 2-carboxy-1,4-naphthoquinone phytyltransferase [Synechococcus sp. RSCCF101]